MKIKSRSGTSFVNSLHYVQHSWTSSDRWYDHLSIESFKYQLCFCVDFNIVFIWPSIPQLISLFPNLLPSTSSYTRAIPPLHQFADISQVYRGDVERLSQCKAFLMQYLEEIRNTELSHGTRAVSVFSKTWIQSNSKPCFIFTWANCNYSIPNTRSYLLWYWNIKEN